MPLYSKFRSCGVAGKKTPKDFEVQVSCHNLPPTRVKPSALVGAGDGQMQS